jgi:hypothetical protein
MRPRGRTAGSSLFHQHLMHFDPQADSTSFAVDFTCLDCRRDICRIVRREPECVRRCLACEAAYVRQVSDRLLAQVRGDELASES